MKIEYDEDGKIVEADVDDVTVTVDFDMVVHDVLPMDPEFLQAFVAARMNWAKKRISLSDVRRERDISPLGRGADTFPVIQDERTEISGQYYV